MKQDWDLVSSAACRKLCLRKPSILLDFLVILLIWPFQVKLDWISTPDTLMTVPLLELHPLVDTGRSLGLSWVCRCIEYYTSVDEIPFPRFFPCCESIQVIL